LKLALYVKGVLPTPTHIDELNDETHLYKFTLAPEGVEVTISVLSGGQTENPGEIEELSQRT
jgi:hypothetical protein